MALPTRVGRCKMSLAVDTGATVSILSIESYLALKRTSHGGRWSLRQSDLNLRGVTGSALETVGMVTLPVTIHKGSSAVRMDFYVVTNFSVPTDGILGLTSMKSNRIDVRPSTNSVIYKGRSVLAMEKPMPLASRNSDSHKCNQRVENDQSNAVASTIIPSVCATRGDVDPLAGWRSEKATVVGNYEVPNRVAMRVKVALKGAPVGSDVCLSGPCKLQKVNVESTLSTVRENHQTTALIVNTSGGPVRVRHGVYLGDALVYDRKVVPEPLEFPTACAAAVRSSTDIERGQRPHLSSFVNVVDYPEWKHGLLQILENHRSAVALPGEQLGATDRTKHTIKLKDGTSPVYIPAYRLPHSQREIVNQQIQDMLKQGVIEHSHSPWNSPLFLVPKKDGSYRPVIDYRKVNERTEDDRYPLPVLSDLLMNLGGGNTIFSTLDLVSGYWQVPMAQESKEITAFSTPSGHYHWLRMPFGLKAAPLTFQRMINTIFAGMLGTSVHAYLDDLIVVSKDAKTHFQDLRMVFQRLQEANLKVKLTKCEFLKSKIQFLGHAVDALGIHTLDNKVAAVKNFPQPRSVDNIRSFLGLAGYYRAFVRNFAALASPLTRMLKKDVEFHWGAVQNKSFQDLKQALIHAPVLAFPDFSKPFEMYTDASAMGLGAVLMQKDSRQKNRPIAYASRVLTPAEANYNVTHQETLGVVWGLKHFKDLIYGYPITVFTDHAAVTEIFRGKNLSGRLARWYLTIQEFMPKFKHLPGRANVVADALSRNVPVGATTQESTIANFSLQELRAEQQKHAVWGKVIFALESGDETSLPPMHVPLSQLYLTKEGVLRRLAAGNSDGNDQWIIPESLVPTVLKLIHDQPAAGHPGRDRTLAAARRAYFWPRMRVDVEEYVGRCVSCAKHKGVPSGPAPMLEYPPPTQPWDVVSIDLLQLPKSHQGSQFLLVCVDHFSRYVVLAPIRNKTATAIAHALITHLICPYTTPRVLLSDNGAEFRNQLLSEICSLYGIKQTFTVAYHPSSNGLVERANRKILDALRPVVRSLYDDWEDWLPHVRACINGSLCESTGKTPHYILYGVDKIMPYDLLAKTPKPVYNVDNYLDQHLHISAKIHKKVREQLQASRAEMMAQQHKRATPINIQKGDTVMVQVPTRDSKLAPKFVGPRLVVGERQGNKFEVWDPFLDVKEVIHSDRLKKTRATDPKLTNYAYVPKDPSSSPPPPNPTNTKHQYNLRSRT